MPQKSTRSRASSATNNDANGENDGATIVATAEAEVARLRALLDKSANEK